MTDADLTAMESARAASVGVDPVPLELLKARNIAFSDGYSLALAEEDRKATQRHALTLEASTHALAQIQLAVAAALDEYRATVTKIANM